MVLALAACGTTGIQGTAHGRAIRFGGAHGTYVDHPGFVDLYIPSAGDPHEYVSIMVELGDCFHDVRGFKPERGGTTYHRGNSESYMAHGHMRVEKCEHDRFRGSLSLEFDDGTRVEGELDIPLTYSAGYD
jgi:hypothetical protein